MNEVLEIWKDIFGYEGYYQISSIGRVRGVDRIIPFTGRGGIPTTRLQRGKILKTSIGTSGYETYHMYGESQERETVMLHRVVAKHFLQLEEGKDFVNHKDGNKLNNVVSNLEWVTKSENTLHALDTGLLLKRGEHCNFSKLTEKDVLEIISLRRYGRGLYTCKHIAARYAICPEYISEIVRAGSGKWEEIKSDLNQEILLKIYEEVTLSWNVPEKAKRKIPVNDISDELAEQIMSRRKAGERVCDIARDLGLTQKFISWYTLKNIRK